MSGVADLALAVIDTKTLEVVETIPRPKDAHWGTLAVDPATGSLYVASEGSVLAIATR